MRNKNGVRKISMPASFISNSGAVVFGWMLSLMIICQLEMDTSSTFTQIQEMNFGQPCWKKPTQSMLNTINH